MIKHLAIFFAITISLTLLGCESRKESYSDLPWQIAINENQHTEVFGIVLAETTLKALQDKWGVRATVGLFENKAKEKVLEAFFERLTLGPFQVKVVAQLMADDDVLNAFKENANPPKPGPSGDYKYTLIEVDQIKAESLPVTEIAYLPGYKVEGTVLKSRFGEPDEIKKVDEGVQVWLYPKKGLIVTIVEKGKDIFHYVNPINFADAVNRLSS